MRPLNRVRRALHAVVLKPVMILIGLEVKNRERLAVAGPTIVVANHNSHMDTAALLAAFRNADVPRVRPAAAADYFLKGRILAWFSTRIIGVVPVNRSGGAETALRWCGAALRRGEMVLLFPEGTRGEPGQASRFRKGVAVLAAEHPNATILPVHIKGTAAVLPKGSWLPIPLGIELVVGDAIHLRDGISVEEATSQIAEAVWNLAA